MHYKSFEYRYIGFIKSICIIQMVRGRSCFFPETNVSQFKVMYCLRMVPRHSDDGHKMRHVQRREKRRQKRRRSRRWRRRYTDARHIAPTLSSSLLRRRHPEVSGQLLPEPDGSGTNPAKLFAQQNLLNCKLEPQIFRLDIWQHTKWYIHSRYFKKAFKHKLSYSNYVGFADQLWCHGVQ